MPVYNVRTGAGTPPSSVDGSYDDSITVTQESELEGPDPDSIWVDGIDSSSEVNSGGGQSTRPTMPPINPTQPDGVDAPEQAQEAKASDQAKETAKKHPVKDIEKLDNLDESFKGKAKEFVEKMQEKGWKMRVVWATRTKEENQELVDRGTASKTSKHLDGQAIDLINRSNPYPDDKDDPYYKDMEATAKEVGVTWGGDFKSRWDPTHIQIKKD